MPNLKFDTYNGFKYFLAEVYKSPIYSFSFFMLWLFEILSPRFLNCSCRKSSICIPLLGFEFGSIFRLGSAVNLVNLVEYDLEPYIFLLLILYSNIK